jgi:predicted RND superfamily exporter protein
MSDLQTTWPIALSVLFMALIISILFLFFIQAFGGCLVWTVIVLYFGVIISFGVVSYLAADHKIVINGIDQLNDP